MEYIINIENSHNGVFVNLLKEYIMTLLPSIALRSFVGFDNFFNEIENFHNIQKQNNYPSYDIVKINDDEYEISLAVSSANKKDGNIQM